VEENNPDSDVTADTTSSNGYFLQLFVAGIVESEEIFFAKAQRTKKPDGVITGSECLNTSEVGFGYIVQTDDSSLPLGSKPRPLVVTPLTTAGDKFDPEPFDGKAVVFRMDNAVTSLNINDSGDAISGGTSILATGPDSVWGSEITPKIVPPAQ